MSPWKEDKATKFLQNWIEKNFICYQVSYVSQKSEIYNLHGNEKWQHDNDMA